MFCAVIALSDPDGVHRRHREIVIKALGTCDLSRFPPQSCHGYLLGCLENDNSRKQNVASVLIS